MNYFDKNFWIFLRRRPSSWRGSSRNRTRRSGRCSCTTRAPKTSSTWTTSLGTSKNFLSTTSRKILNSIKARCHIRLYDASIAIWIKKFLLFFTLHRGNPEMISSPSMLSFHIPFSHEFYALHCVLEVLIHWFIYEWKLTISISKKLCNAGSD